MATSKVENSISDLKQKDKRKRKKAVENLGKEGLQLSSSENEIQILKNAISALEGIESKDKEKDVKNSARDVLKNLKPHLTNLEADFERSKAAPETTDAWATSEVPEDSLQPALDYMLTEVLNGTLALDGELKDLETSATLYLKNLTNNERIFDVMFTIQEKGLSTLEEEYYFPEIDAGEEKIIEYKFNVEDTSDVALEFLEIVDTFPDTEEQSNVLVFGQTMETKLKYKYTAKKNLQKITVKKTFPTGFSNVQVEQATHGTHNIESDSLEWTLEDITEGQEGELIVSGSFDVQELEDISTGQVNVSFYSEQALHSGVEISGERTGQVRSKQLVESTEIETKPDNWENQFIYENPSEIDVKLRQISISDEENTYIDDKTEKIVPAGDKWESEVFESISEEVPMFSASLDMQIASRVVINTQSDLIVEPGALRVANINASKEYEVTVIPSYRETPIKGTTVIENIGAIDFENTVIKEDIPEDFLPPENEKMTVTMVFEDATEEILRDDTDYEYLIEGDPENSEEIHKITLKCLKILPPKGKLVWESYPRAYRPLPDKEYEFQSHITAELTEKAPPLEFDIVEDLPKLTVIHERRRVTIGKSVTELGTKKASYEIMLNYKNRGNKILEELVLKDFIPKPFKVAEESISYENTEEEVPEIIAEEEEFVTETAEGSIRTWVFPQVHPDQEIQVIYSIKGKGKYKARHAQMSFT
ncbi:MAG: hypothetical protein ACXAC7_11125 [Candidatus Hodarchaeales archaeon]|jgi:hypothetical protein